MALGRAAQLRRVTKSGYRNGAEARASIAAARFGRAGGIMASQSSGLLNDQISWPEVWLVGGWLYTRRDGHTGGGETCGSGMKRLPGLVTIDVENINFQAVF